MPEKISYREMVEASNGVENKKGISLSSLMGDLGSIVGA